MGQIVRRVVKIGDKPTPEQIKEIEEAMKAEPVFDEDCPEYSSEELEAMRLAAIEKRKEQKKRVVTLRISEGALKQAKAMGKGYTGFLGRLIENGLKDKDLVMRSL